MERIEHILSWLSELSPGVREVVPDGRIHRFGKNKTCWYVARELNEFGKPHVLFIYAGDWRTGVEGSAYYSEKRVTKSLLQSESKKLLDTVAHEVRAEQERVAEKAAELLADLPTVGEVGQDYLKRKQILDVVPHVPGLRVDPGKGTLFVPCYASGHLWGFQRILKTGKKYFMEAQKADGVYCVIGPDATGTTCLVEGFATGASVHLATGYRVIVAFSVHHLLAVGRHFLKTEPGRYILCGDDDFETIRPVVNPGMSIGSDVAYNLGIPAVFPVFSKTEQRGTDFNDLHVTEGLDVVEAQINAALAKDTEATDNIDSSRRIQHKNSDQLHFMDIAQAIVDDNHFISDKYRNTYEYNGVHWVPIDNAELEKIAARYDAFYSSNKNRRNEILAAIKIITLYGKGSIPWRRLKDFEVPFKNGVLDLTTYRLREHRDTDFLETVLPVDFDPDALSPLWEKTLGQWFGDCSQKIVALQEFFGYVLMPHAKYKKGLILYGEPNTGKSLVNKILESLVGDENICHISVVDMDDPRKLAPIKGKMLNSVQELSHNALLADGGFKRLVSTGESIQIDEKYKPAESYLPFAKHVICTNTLPKINDRTSATYDRILLIHFERQFSEHERDWNLDEKLKEELTGIATWAAEGAAMLYAARGKFSKIDESESILLQHRLENNPVYEWAEQFLQKIEGISTPNSVAYNHYVSNSGHRRPVSRVWFFRHLAALGYVSEVGYKPGSGNYGTSEKCLVNCRIDGSVTSTFSERHRDASLFD